MKTKFALGALALAIAAIANPAAAQQFHRLESATVIKVAQPEWDYLTIDPDHGHLFIAARDNGVVVYDVKAKKVLKTLEKSEGANASVVVPEFDRGYTVNEDGSITAFTLSTLKVIDRVKLGEDADAGFYDPKTKQIVVTRGDSKELTFVDAKSGKVTGRLAMESKKLEATVADGKGVAFTASRDRNSVFKIDMENRKQLAEWPVCDEANGIAMDRERGRVFVGCRGKNPVLAVLDADSGKVITTLEIGRGNDGVIYDPETRKIYASAGVDANLVIYQQVDADNYKLVEATTTRPYARTMALDPKTKKVYLVTAEGTADPARKMSKGPAHFYPNRYFPGTFTLLTYAPK